MKKFLLSAIIAMSIFVSHAQTIILPNPSLTAWQMTKESDGGYTIFATFNGPFGVVISTPSGPAGILNPTEMDIVFLVTIQQFHTKITRTISVTLDLSSVNFGEPTYIDEDDISLAGSLPVGLIIGMTVISHTIVGEI